MISKDDLLDYFYQHYASKNPNSPYDLSEANILGENGVFADSEIPFPAEWYSDFVKYHVKRNQNEKVHDKCFMYAGMKLRPEGDVSESELSEATSAFMPSGYNYDDFYTAAATKNGKDSKRFRIFGFSEGNYTITQGAEHPEKLDDVIPTREHLILIKRGDAPIKAQIGGIV